MHVHEPPTVAYEVLLPLGDKDRSEAAAEAEVVPGVTGSSLMMDDGAAAHASLLGSATVIPSPWPRACPARCSLASVGR
jgi:hypothetical protein